MNHLLIFTKHPAPGFAKTRLIPSQGGEQAAEISRRLTEHTITTTRDLQKSQPDTVHTFIHHANPLTIPGSRTKQWIQPTSHETLVAQVTGSLGDRLISAFTQSFAMAEVCKVVVIGTDTPGVSVNILSSAFAALDDNDVVIGPAIDGGYYLLGTTKLHTSLFQNIPWSTSTVCADTVTAALRLHLSVFKLQPLRDIDEPEDLVNEPLSDLRAPPLAFGRP